MAAPPLLDIRKLCVGFRSRAGTILPVLHEVDLGVCRGESLGIVGESGSGKSTLALAAMGYLRHGLQRLSGEVIYDGRDMFGLLPAELARVRGGKLGLIPQNSGQALTPTQRIGAQIREALQLHCDHDPATHHAHACALLEQVRLPDPEVILRRYPHELSGGQQQRVAIAMALAGEPDALLLDEPTTGLDVTTQAHILDLLRDLARARDMAMVYVSHDLGVIARVCDRVQVLYAGETLGLVGESGSGKSTILRAIAGLLAPVSGEIALGDGTRLAGAVERRSPTDLRRIQMIFQNPDESLNPRQSVGEILAQPLRLYFGLKGQALADRATELLDSVRLGAHYLERRPGQLSGGEKQRVAVARAFAAGPEVVLCDEITSALDVSVQAAVLDLLNDLKARHGTAFIFVSHDLTVVRALSDRVAVLYQGRICETGPAAAVYNAPNHPYTEVLLGAVLAPDPDHAPRLLAEDATELAPPARGCPFQRRCPVKLGALCETDTPPAQDAGDGHIIHCHIPLGELCARAG